MSSNSNIAGPPSDFGPGSKLFRTSAPALPPDVRQGYALPAGIEKLKWGCAPYKGLSP